jgi:hypothetical protein
MALAVSSDRIHTLEGVSMSGIEVNEDQDTASAEQRVQDASASFAEARGQVMQAMAQAAGGIAGAVAGAMSAPFTAAATVRAPAGEPERQFGEGEHEDDSEDDGQENIQHQQQAGDAGPQPTSGSEPVQQG